MRHSAWLGSLLVAIAAMGCGTDPIDRAVAQSEAAADIICTCPGAIGAASETECRTMLEMTQPTDEEIACMRRVYSAYASELDPAFDCQYEANADFQDCLRAALATCPPDSAETSACGMAFGEAAEACPMASEQATTELNACFAGRM